MNLENYFEESEDQAYLETRQTAEAINYALSFFEVPIISNIGRQCGASTIEMITTGLIYTSFGDFTLQLMPKGSISEPTCLVAIDSITHEKVLIDSTLIEQNLNLEKIIIQIIEEIQDSNREC